MFKLKISHHREFYDYLEKKHIPVNNDIFTFLHFEHFVKLTSNFISNYIVLTEIDKLITNEVINNSDKDTFYSYIDSNFINEIQFFISNTLSIRVNEISNFSVSHFISFFMNDIQKQIQNTLYDFIPYLSNKSSDIVLGEEKEDVLYMVIEPNGSTTIEKKDCTVISNYSYNQQEQSVAEVLYINPSQLIVFDSMHLLKPEMALCLKKILRKKVVFLEQEHPLRKS